MKKSVIICLAAALLLSCASCSRSAPSPSSEGEGGGSQTRGDVSGTASEEPSTSSESESSPSDVTSETTGSGVTGDRPATSGRLTTTSRSTTKTQSTTGGKDATNGTTTTKVAATTTTKQQEDAMTAAIQAFLNVKPATVRLPAYNPDSHPTTSVNDWSHIQAITYDGAVINNKKTKVFAYIGFPEGASASNKVPAIVLVHGGGGHAYAEWVKLWTDKGYAAIAMDTTGFFPSAAGKGVAGRESDAASLWNYGLYGDFAQAGYGNAPNNDEMKNSSQPLDRQWMFHAVADTILARNILAADSRVDAAKIGITGISWGGVITSLAIGYDTRYAFAIPIYGSGYLEQAHSWMGPIFAKANTKKIWSAANRFDKVSMPVLWLGWSNDNCFSINSNSLSYEATKSAGAVLSMKIHWNHSHGSGWQPQESYHFADSIVKGGPTMTTCVTEPAGRAISFTIKKASDATEVTAQACYITEKLSYSSKTASAWPTIDQQWKAVPCSISGNTVTATLPSNAVSYYVELTTKTPSGKYVTTTRFVEGIR